MVATYLQLTCMSPKCIYANKSQKIIRENYFSKFVFHRNINIADKEEIHVRHTMIGQDA